MDKILQTDNLKLLGDVGDSGFRLYLFTPNLIKLFPKSGKMHVMNFKQKIRFGLLLIHGYRVYVLADCSDNVVGCVCFANAKSYRYPFANKNDLICGPYYVKPEFRRQGIATMLLEHVIDRYEDCYHTIYAHIWNENKASIDCMKKIGFLYSGNLSSSGILQRFVFDDNGKMILVKKRKQDKK